MQHSLRKIQPAFDFPNQDTTHLFEAILELKTTQDCEHFFRDLCTLSELKIMSERWHIACLLWQGFPYRTIMRKTKASSTTIARVSHWLQYGNGGLQRLCRRLAIAQADDEYRALLHALPTVHPAS